MSNNFLLLLFGNIHYKPSFDLKRICFTILLVFTILVGFSQKTKINYLTTFEDKKIHFGFSLGINSLDFGIENYNPIGENPDFFPGVWEGDAFQVNADDVVFSDISKNVAGFTVGIITSLRLSRDLNLRFLPGLSFGERRLIYNIPVVDVNNVYITDNYEYSIKSTFLDFPLLIKYKARRINNDRPYIVLGGSYKRDISRSANEDLVRLNKNGFYAEVGMGWDTFLHFFRFSMEAKVSIGLTNQLGEAPNLTQRQFYSRSIKRLTSNVFTLCFHFE